MIHNLYTIAKNHYLNPIAFEAYAKCKPHLLVDGDGVPTYNVDELVDGYKESIGASIYAHDRADLVECELKYLRDIS